MTMVVMTALLTALVLPPSPALQLRREWGAVLPADYWPANWYRWCREAPGRSGYWAPDAETITALEVALAPALDRALEQEARGRYKPPAAADYYRQYIGIRIGRRQVVYINGFHSSSVADNWRTRAVIVCDGGSHFFGAEYDPATRQIANIRFNGPGDL